MKYLEELLKISELENYSFNKEIEDTFHDTLIFDEIPLISRTDHCLNLEKIYTASQLNAYLKQTLSMMVTM